MYTLYSAMDSFAESVTCCAKTRWGCFALPKWQIARPQALVSVGQGVAKVQKHHHFRGSKQLKRHTTGKYTVYTVYMVYTMYTLHSRAEVHRHKHMCLLGQLTKCKKEPDDSLTVNQTYFLNWSVGKWKVWKSYNSYFKIQFIIFQ